MLRALQEAVSPGGRAHPPGRPNGGRRRRCRQGCGDGLPVRRGGHSRCRLARADLFGSGPHRPLELLVFAAAAHLVRDQPVPRPGRRALRRGRPGAAPRPGADPAARPSQCALRAPGVAGSRPANRAERTQPRSNRAPAFSARTGGVRAHRLRHRQRRHRRRTGRGGGHRGHAAQARLRQARDPRAAAAFALHLLKRTGPAQGRPGAFRTLRRGQTPSLPEPTLPANAFLLAWSRHVGSQLLVRDRLGT
ncbi:hypothetical protein VARIO8X_50538 [Burkholderiales bacterium 8X]|nr:hypothetical protein VARIO8X_50538 [Burkholderiales bacterium 8X]